MLIQFRTENHRSIRDEQVLSLVASRTDREDPRLIRVEGLGEDLLRAVAIYGANASGKSNLLDALMFVGEAVHLSARSWRPDGGVPRAAFMLDEQGSARPSLYELEFMSGGVRYRYGFVTDDDRFLEEWLFAWPKGRRQTWFERDVDEFHFGRGLKGRNETIAELTRPNSLFLSWAVQANHPQLGGLAAEMLVSMRTVMAAKPAQDAARDGFFDFYKAIDGVRAEDGALDADAQRRRAFVLGLLRAADLGITDFVVVDSDDEKPVRTEGPDLMLWHASSDPEGSPIHMVFESDGTKKLLHTLPQIWIALETGTPLVFDEFERSFHPLLAAEILRLFQDPSCNPKGAQLIFTTHDTTLLGTMLGARLRRDQIWFTEKDEVGASHVYPLTDFHPRKAENLQRGYLQGRYGAVPFVGDPAWQDSGEE